jgi:cytoskeletal protein CcmA (bactofilin family)
MSDNRQEYGTIIGPDATFKGDLSFESAAKVLGKFEGSITSKGKVNVADGSRCKATIAAKEIAVEGHIEGNVEATDLVELKPNGVITGDVVAARMSMADGSSINGYCRIGKNGQGAAKSTQSTEVKPAAQPQQQQPAQAQRATATAKK